MSDRILDTFCAHQGVISLVGAGGKKSTIFRLASAHKGKIGITSTVYTPPFRRRLNAYPVVAESGSLFEEVKSAAATHGRVAYAHNSEKSARLAGVSPADISHIHSALQFDATFVKADGARLRWLKAPDSDEPVVPGDTRVLIPVLSVRAIGMRLSEEIAHRARNVARIMQVELGDRVTAVHLARLLTSSEGSLKNAGTAIVIPVLNMAESKEDVRLSRLVAEQALERSSRIERVVIASMVREDPVVEVVDRQG